MHVTASLTRTRRVVAFAATSLALALLVCLTTTTTTTTVHLAAAVLRNYNIGTVKEAQQSVWDPTREWHVFRSLDDNPSSRWIYAWDPRTRLPTLLAGNGAAGPATTNAIGTSAAVQTANGITMYVRGSDGALIGYLTPDKPSDILLFIGNSGTYPVEFATTGGNGYVNGAYNLAKFAGMRALCYHQGMRRSFVADSSNKRFRALADSGTLHQLDVSHLAGDGTSAYVDGTALTARFQDPHACAMLPSTGAAPSAAFLTEANPVRLRRLSPVTGGGTVSTITSSAGGTVASFEELNSGYITLLTYHVVGTNEVRVLRFHVDNIASPGPWGTWNLPGALDGGSWAATYWAHLMINGTMFTTTATSPTIRVFQRGDIFFGTGTPTRELTQTKMPPRTGRGLVRRLTFTFSSGDGTPTRIAADSTSIYILTAASKLLKFSMASNTLSAALTVSQGFTYSVIVVGAFAYVTNALAPAKVTKVNTAGSMSEVSTITLSGQALAEGNPYTLIADSTSIYVSCIEPFTSPSIISKIDIATFARPAVGPRQLQLLAGETNVWALALNTAMTFLFACSATVAPTTCARIELAGFSHAGSVTLASAAGVYGIAHDASHLYLTTNSFAPAKVYKVFTNLPSGAMSLVTSVTLPPLSDYGRAMAFMPLDAQHVYVITATSPMRAVQLHRSDLRLAGPVGVAGPGDNSVGVECAVGVGNRVYTATSTDPPRLVVWAAPTRTVTERRTATGSPEASESSSHTFTRGMVTPSDSLTPTRGATTTRTRVVRPSRTRSRSLADSLTRTRTLAPPPPTNTSTTMPTTTATTTTTTATTTTTTTAATTTTTTSSNATPTSLNTTTTTGITSGTTTATATTAASTVGANSTTAPNGSVSSNTTTTTAATTTTTTEAMTSPAPTTTTAAVTGVRIVSNVTFEDPLASPVPPAELDAVSTGTTIASAAGAAAAAQTLRAMTLLGIIQTEERCRLQAVDADRFAAEPRMFPESFLPWLRIAGPNASDDARFGLPSRRGAIVANAFIGPVIVAAAAALIGVVRKLLFKSMADVSPLAAGRVLGITAAVTGSLAMDGVFASAVVLLSVPGGPSGGDVALALFGMLTVAAIPVAVGVVLYKVMQREAATDRPIKCVPAVICRNVKSDGKDAVSGGGGGGEARKATGVMWLVFGSTLWVGDLGVREMFGPIFSKNRGDRKLATQHWSVTARRRLATWSFYIECLQTAVAATGRGWATARPCDANRHVQAMQLAIALLALIYAVVVQPSISPLRRVVDVAVSFTIVVGAAMLVNRGSEAAHAVARCALGAGAIAMLTALVMIVARRLVLPLMKLKICAKEDALEALAGVRDAGAMDEALLSFVAPSFGPPQLMPLPVHDATNNPLGSDEQPAVEKNAATTTRHNDELEFDL